MKRTSRIFVKRLSRAALPIAAACLLISTIGCSRRFVAVDTTKPTTINQGELERVYQDNELLLKALKDCHSGR